MGLQNHEKYFLGHFYFHLESKYCPILSHLRARVGVRAGAGPQPIMAANLEIIC